MARAWACPSSWDIPVGRVWGQDRPALPAHGGGQGGEEAAKRGEREIREGTLSCPSVQGGLGSEHFRK